MVLSGEGLDTASKGVSGLKKTLPSIPGTDVLSERVPLRQYIHFKSYVSAGRNVRGGRA